MTQALTTLANTVQQIVRSKAENMLVSGDSFLRLCTPSFSPDAALKIGDLAVSAGFSTKSGTGAPSAAEVRSFASTSAPTERHKAHVFERSRLNDLPSLAEEIAALSWDQAWAEINNDFYSLILGGKTVAHPDNGVSDSPYAANGGGTVYAIDNYDMTFLDASTATQTNDHTLALSSDNLTTLLAKRRTYKMRSGKAGLPQFAPYLVVVPGLETLARDLAAQSGRLYNGTGLESGFSGRIRDVIVAPGGATSSLDSWALVWVEESVGMDGMPRKNGPVHCHIPMVPQFEIEKVVGAGDINVYTSFKYDNFFAPNCDNNLFFSEP